MGKNSAKESSMKHLVFILFIITSINAFAKNDDWILRAEIKTMRSDDRIWINNEGDFYWATMIFADSMPCNIKLEKAEIDELSLLVNNLPAVTYEREFNNQCMDGQAFFILVKRNQGDGTYKELGKEFPGWQDCRKYSIDKSWDDLADLLYRYTEEKFESCRNVP